MIKMNKVQSKKFIIAGMVKRYIHDCHAITYHQRS